MWPANHTPQIKAEDRKFSHRTQWPRLLLLSATLPAAASAQRKTGASVTRGRCTIRGEETAFAQFRQHDPRTDSDSGAEAG